MTRKMKKSPNFLSEMRIEPIFAYGFPKDKMDELQRAQLELQMKLGSRREIMERMGKQNIPELLDEIDEDTIHAGVLEARIGELLNAGNEDTPPEGGEEGSNGNRNNTPPEEL